MYICRVSVTFRLPHIVALRAKLTKIWRSCKLTDFQISVFHRAFFNSVIDKHQHMHFTFNNILVYSADFDVKIYKST